MVRKLLEVVDPLDLPVPMVTGLVTLVIQDFAFREFASLVRHDQAATMVFRACSIPSFYS